MAEILIVAIAIITSFLFGRFLRIKNYEEQLNEFEKYVHKECKQFIRIEPYHKETLYVREEVPYWMLNKTDDTVIIDVVTKEITNKLANELYKYIKLYEMFDIEQNAKIYQGEITILVKDGEKNGGEN